MLTKVQKPFSIEIHGNNRFYIECSFMEDSQFHWKCHDSEIVN